MSETTTDHFEAGLATLSADAKRDFPEQSPWKVNGVAIPENQVVNGGQNVDHFFPPEVLDGGGKLLEGKPIVVDFHELDGQADASNVIGEVTSAGHQKGVGLVFEGEIVDAEIANKVKHGYLDVSPTPARSLGEFDDSMGAQRVERLADFRDLAVVVNGQPGAEIQMGSNPAVEALARDTLSNGFDTLQEDDSNLDLTPPQTAQENAEKVLKWREEHPEEINGMTEVGWNRAEQLASGEELSREVVKKMAQFNRHRKNSDVAEEHEGKPWMDAGHVAWLGWGGDAGIDWALRMSDKMDTMSSTDTLQRTTARRPTFDGTETNEEQPWGDVSKDLSSWADALNIEAESVADMTDAEKATIAEHTLLGDASAETWENLLFFPVVNPNTGNLNEGALNAVRGGRGEQADIPADAQADAEEMAEELLADEFEGYEMEDGELVTVDTESNVVPVVTEVPVKEQKNEVTIVE